MRNMLLILEKDVRSFFSSYVAYAVTGIFLLITGYFAFSSFLYFSLISFQLANNPFMGAERINLTEVVLPALFLNMGVILLLMMPVLTMRSFAEERKRGTHQLLCTLPLRDTEIVWGKYLACLCVFLVMTLPTSLYFVVLRAVGGVFEWKILLSAYLGLVLLGGSFIALGVFVSTVTDSQVVAASLSFGCLLLFWILGWSGEMARGWFSAFLQNLSIFFHFERFAKGVISLADILYYVLFIAFFLYATLRALELRVWRS